MPKYDTWDALAAALKINARELHRMRKLPGAPGESKDLDDWRNYIDSSNRFDTEGLPATSYDEALKKGRVDTDSALKHSRIVEQEIINEMKREELKKARGDTIAKADHEAKVVAVVDRCVAALAILPDLYADGLPSDERPAGRRLAKDWVAAIRAEFSKNLRA